jgi:site-specific DNA-methyltransferase (adenine-specific)
LEEIKLIQGDCLEVMKSIPDKSIDAIICDLPYGTTACKWDSIIPFEPLWEQYNRVVKDKGAIVLFATQPFTSTLIASNLEMFRYAWVWDKDYGTDFQLAKLRPMRCHEDIAIFSHSKTANGAASNMNYYPQKTPLKKPVKNGGAPTTKLLRDNSMKQLDLIYTEKSPMTVIKMSPVFNSINTPRLHPTQKPVALMEYLIKTYTNQGEIVLDNCMGSGTTGVACKNLGRKFIGIEQDANYFEIASKRIYG